MELSGYSVDTVRKHNLRLIMHLLYIKSQSCKELSHETGLSETAIKKNIVQLLESNVVKACNESNDEKKSVGRQHIRYEVNKDFGQFLLLDLSYRKDMFIITDVCGKELYFGKFDLPSAIDNKSLDYIFQKIINVCKEKNFNIKEIAMSIPGQINEENGIINFSSRFDKANIKNLKDIVSSYYPNTEIFIKNDLRYEVYGDPKVLERSENTITSYFLIGYGITSAYVKNGAIIQGYNGISGEIGGLERMDKDYIHEKCSIPGLILQANKIEKCETLSDLLTLYKSNEKIHDLVLESAKYFSYDVDCITNAIGSSNIVFYGEITEFGEEYKEVVQQELNKFPYFKRTVEMIDCNNFSKMGMIKKLQEHIVRCID